jgi:hypothetical protein
MGAEVNAFLWITCPTLAGIAFMVRRGRQIQTGDYGRGWGSEEHAMQRQSHWILRQEKTGQEARYSLGDIANQPRKAVENAAWSE